MMIYQGIDKLRETFFGEENSNCPRSILCEMQFRTLSLWPFHRIISILSQDFKNALVFIKSFNHCFTLKAKGDLQQEDEYVCFMDQPFSTRQ